MITDQIRIRKNGSELYSVPKAGFLHMPDQVEFLVTLPEGDIEHLRLQDLSQDEVDGVIAWLGPEFGTLFVAGGEFLWEERETVKDVVYWRHQYRKSIGLA